METGPLFWYRHWERQVINHRHRSLSKHHLVPRSRITDFQDEIASAVGEFLQRDNIIKINPVTHQLWHFLFDNLTPWEVIVFLNQPNGVFEEWTPIKVFGWLMIFSGFCPELIGELIVSANGNIGQLCLEIACKEQAKDIVLKRWVPEVLYGFTLEKAKTALVN